MADFIPVGRPVQKNVPTPLTLTQLQSFVAGFIQYVELSSGDYLIVNEAWLNGLAPINLNATALVGRPVYGDVVICSPSEIA